MQTAEATCCEDNCKIQMNNQEAQVLDERIKKGIECKLIAFDEAIKAHKHLEIDGVTEEGKLKVLNHKTEEAHEVEVDTIIKTPLQSLILALEIGETITLYGVTRIVGYYSRIHNWNKSKIGELQDRHRGQYSVGSKP